MPSSGQGARAPRPPVGLLLRDHGRLADTERPVTRRAHVSPLERPSDRLPLAPRADHRSVQRASPITMTGASSSVSPNASNASTICGLLDVCGPAVRVDVRAPSRSAVFRDGQYVSGVERVFTRHNPLVFQVRETV